MFFPNFSTFTLDTPLVSRQRWSEEQESTMFFPNFLTFTLETPILFQHRRIEDTEEKEDLHLHFLINYVQEEKTNFSNIKGVQRTYVTVANQSTVHRTNPTKTRHTSVASPSNKSFRTNTFVRRQTHQLYFSNFSAWSENIIGRNQFFFSKPDSVNTKTVFSESPTKKYLHFANFQKAGQPLKEVSLDRQYSK